MGDSFAHTAKYALPAKPNDTELAPTNSSGASVEAISAFVGTQGTDFVVNGQVHFFSGSNDYFLILRYFPVPFLTSGVHLTALCLVRACPLACAGTTLQTLKWPPSSRCGCTISHLSHRCHDCRRPDFALSMVELPAGVRPQTMASKGIDLVRTWGFLNGQHDTIDPGVALQPSVRIHALHAASPELIAAT